ncbi:hypothetical protein A3J44_06025 [candidate division WOR-1 bacterium RIFCSPHIGHO2_02_FULL_45_12]|nr:MAG: hypothetical protein A3J44_06025 [candidate division WOR-1 bacterium RIFCSPHIGHO2_02_FULL_45_12]
MVSRLTNKSQVNSCGWLVMFFKSAASFCLFAKPILANRLVQRGETLLLIKVLIKPTLLVVGLAGLITYTSFLYIYRQFLVEIAGDFGNEGKA